MAGEIINYFRKKTLWILSVLGILGVWGILYLNYLPDGKMRIVFCDVGQGDGIYIDLPNGEDVLIDGGPNKKVLECLGENMPFWDKKIEIVVLTHPQADHLNGLVDVLERYEVGYFISSPVGNDTKGYSELVSLIQKNSTLVRNVYSGEVIKIKNEKGKMKNEEEVIFRVLWPSMEFTDENLLADTAENLSAGSVDSVLGMSTTRDDLNDFSIVLELKFRDFEALLGGDADEGIQDDILAGADVKQVEVFKIPHHGSKYGLLEEYLDIVRPIAGVVSVGKNQWGHPTKEILKKLEARDVKLYRTDKNGDVKVITDGKQYWIESDKK